MLDQLLVLLLIAATAEAAVSPPPTSSYYEVSYCVASSLQHTCDLVPVVTKLTEQPVTGRCDETQDQAGSVSYADLTLPAGKVLLVDANSMNSELRYDTGRAFGVSRFDASSQATATRASGFPIPGCQTTATGPPTQQITARLPPFPATDDVSTGAAIGLPDNLHRSIGLPDIRYRANGLPDIRYRANGLPDTATQQITARLPPCPTTDDFSLG